MKTCNDTVLTDAVAATGESKELIQDAVRFQMDFISRKIEEGSFEAVRIHNFGCFRAKPRSVQWRDFMRSLPEGFRQIIKTRAKK